MSLACVAASVSTTLTAVEVTTNRCWPPPRAGFPKRRPASTSELYDHASLLLQRGCCEPELSDWGESNSNQAAATAMSLPQECKAQLLTRDRC